MANEYTVRDIVEKAQAKGYVNGTTEGKTLEEFEFLVDSMIEGIGEGQTAIGVAFDLEEEQLGHLMHKVSSALSAASMETAANTVPGWQPMLELLTHHHEMMEIVCGSAFLYGIHFANTEMK
jgi:hypothetical protein